MRQQDFVRLITQSVAAHRLRSFLDGARHRHRRHGRGAADIDRRGLEHLHGRAGSRSSARQPSPCSPASSSTFGISPGVLELRAAAGAWPTPRRSRARRTRWHSVPMVTGSASVGGARPRAHRCGVRCRTGLRQGVQVRRRRRLILLPHDEFERARNVAVLGATLYFGAVRLEQRARRPHPRRGATLSRHRHHGVRGRHRRRRPRRHRLHSRPRAASSCSTGRAARDRRALRRGRARRRSRRGVKRILAARHGAEDFTVITQQQMLDVLGSIVDVLTLGVAALGGISLLVGGVGIFTIMTIAVRERTQEIGLLRAIGARRSRIARLFVGEAMLLSGDRRRRRARAGAAQSCCSRSGRCPRCRRRSRRCMSRCRSALAVRHRAVAGMLPARSAARLEPLDALRAE